MPIDKGLFASKALDVRWKTNSNGLRGNYVGAVQDLLATGTTSWRALVTFDVGSCKVALSILDDHPLLNRFHGFSAARHSHRC